MCRWNIAAVAMMKTPCTPDCRGPLSEVFTGYNSAGQRIGGAVTGDDMVHLLGMGAGHAKFIQAMKDAARHNDGFVTAASIAVEADKLSTFTNAETAFARGQYDLIAPTSTTALQEKMYTTEKERLALKKSVRRQVDNLTLREEESIAAAGGDTGGKYLTSNLFYRTGSQAAISDKLQRMGYQYAHLAYEPGEDAANEAHSRELYRKLVNGGVSMPETEQEWVDKRRDALSYDRYFNVDYTPESAQKTLESRLYRQFSGARRHPLNLANTRKPTTNNFFESYGNTSIYY